MNKLAALGRYICQLIVPNSGLNINIIEEQGILHMINGSLC